MRPIQRVLLSMLSLAIAWLLGMAVFTLHGYLTWGYPADLFSMAYWSGIFSAFGWVVFVVPLLLIAGSRLDSWPLSWLTLLGMLIGLAAFAVLVSWWTGFWRYWLYLLIPAVIGAGGGLAYGIGTKLLTNNDPHK